MKTEDLVLKALVLDKDFCRAALPHLKLEYFETDVSRAMFKIILDFNQKYGVPPTMDALEIEIQKVPKLSDKSVKEAADTILSFRKSEPLPNDKYLIKIAEEWCQERAMYLALVESLSIADKEHKTLSKGAIPGLLQDALAVTFTTDVGHDYKNDAESRFDFYRNKEKKFPFDIDFLNKITRGGVPSKTCNLIMAGTNVGKTLWLCHFAAMYLSQGIDVLYITAEMASEWISQRIDMNLLNFTEEELETIPKDIYLDRVEKKLRKKATGNVIVVQYAPNTFTNLTLKALLSELKTKKGFDPKVIIADYIMILASSTLKPGDRSNMYLYGKTVAEEFRGVAIEEDKIFWSASQANRDGQDNTDISFKNVAQSHGLSETADFMLAVMSTDELEKLNQYLAKQLKNRYNRKAKDRKFVVGVDYDHMRLFNVEQPQAGLVKDDDPVPVSIAQKAKDANKKSKFGALKV